MPKILEFNTLKSLVMPFVELCADVIVSAAARRSILVGGCAPPVQTNRRRRRGEAKNLFQRFPKKFRSILKISFYPQNFSRR